MFDINKGLLDYMTNGLLLFSETWQYTLVLLGFALFSMVAAYLLGSINSAILISKVLYRDDIRNHGSGNGGMTNMLRTFGKGAAGLTLLGDLLKTVLAVCIAGLLLGFNYAGGICHGDGYCYVAGLFAVIGHIFPIYYGFKGGKGVLVTSAMALVVSPIPFLILLVIFVVVVWLSKYVSLGSVIVAVLYPVVLTGYIKMMGAPLPGLLTLCTILIAIIIVYCHRENLQRISDRTERKISFSKKDVEVKKEADEDGDDE